MYLKAYMDVFVVLLNNYLAFYWVGFTFLISEQDKCRRFYAPKSVPAAKSKRVQFNEKDVD